MGTTSQHLQRSLSRAKHLIMKTLALLMVVVYVAYVASESCVSTNFNQFTDCPSEECHIDMHTGCVQDICTCIVNYQHSCVTKSDCNTFQDKSFNCSATSDHGHARDWHCTDNFCHCSGSHGTHGNHGN